MKFQFSLILIILFLGSCSETNQVDPNPTPVNGAAGVIQDDFEGLQLVIYANSDLLTMVAYSRTTASGKTLDFQLSTMGFPTILTDNDGTEWDIFGNAVSGPGAGDRLLPVTDILGFWFGFSSFFPKVTLYGEAENERLADDLPNADWLVNPDEVHKGALRDGIPSIDNPVFENYDGTSDPYTDDKLMIVIEDGTSLKAYPHAILNWHEITNDVINGKNATVSYCPLTGTSRAWNSIVGGALPSEFGTSGLLYNDNLILYDRNSENLWSQIMGKSINGNLLGSEREDLNIVEMSWGAVKAMQKPIELLSTDTGFTRDYNKYPYGDYKSNPNVLFPITYTDDRLHPKARVLAVIINDKAKVYQFEDFVQ